MIDACDDCLRRTWLIAALGGHIAIEWRRRRGLTDLFALDDDQLIDALAGKERAQILARRAGFRAQPARARCRAAGLSVLCCHACRYPELLRETSDPPAVMHVGGSLEGFLAMIDGPTVAIVGARRGSQYGLDVARSLGRGLAAAGVTVVSGMALGIDSAAHEGALQLARPAGPGAADERGPAPPNRAIAVLAGGADVAYPASKRRLHAELLAEGAVVSELPPSFVAHRWCFPARNRVIAGLSRLTVVVEAGLRSGSLITASFANELGRQVAAVPGRVTAPQAVGTNELIYDGAQLVRDAADVLDLIFGAGAGARATAEERRGDALSPALRRLLREVADGRETLAALATTADEAEAAMAGLAELELLGYLRRAIGGRYVPVV